MYSVDLWTSYSLDVHVNSYMYVYVALYKALANLSWFPPVWISMQTFFVLTFGRNLWRINIRGRIVIINGNGRSQIEKSVLHLVRIQQIELTMSSRKFWHISLSYFLLPSFVSILFCLLSSLMNPFSILELPGTV